jgi:hypothetical protein
MGSSTEAAGSKEKVPSKEKMPLAASLPGRVKVRLRYLTSQPRHLRSMLLAQYGAQPPFIEEACVLLPHMAVFPVLECFLPTFEALREDSAVPPDARLQAFDILDRDVLTLSYVP